MNNLLERFIKEIEGLKNKTMKKYKFNPLDWQRVLWQMDFIPYYDKKEGFIPILKIHRDIIGKNCPSKN